MASWSHCCCCCCCCFILLLSSNINVFSAKQTSTARSHDLPGHVTSLPVGGAISSSLPGVPAADHQKQSAAIVVNSKLHNFNDTSLYHKQLLQRHSAGGATSRQRRHSDLYYSSKQLTDNHQVSVLGHHKAADILSRLSSKLKSAQQNCLTLPSQSIVRLDVDLDPAVLHKFRPELASAVHAANVLSLLVNSVSSRTESFYYSFVRAMVSSADDWVHSVSLVLDRSPLQPLLAPRARRTSTAVHVTTDVANTEWYSTLLQYNVTSGRICSANETPAIESRDALWAEPYVLCPSVLLSVVLPVYSCDQQSLQLTIRGAVRVDIDLDKVEVNQCSDSTDVFAGTHRCPPSTLCAPNLRLGLRTGNYRCQCTTGFYFPSPPPATQHFEGTKVEEQYDLMVAGQPHEYSNLVCLQCARGCMSCDDPTPCYDVIATRVILLTVQLFTMVASIAVGVAIVRLRKTKVMKASFWLLLEVVILGVLLVQSTVVVEYFDVSDIQCLLVPWLREVGFTVVYGSLMLKAYRVLAEFQSRKAQRILLRDKDLLKYLLSLVIIIIGYLVTWTVITLEHVTVSHDDHLIETRHVTASNLVLVYCSIGWWHYVIECGECLFLCIGIYLCYCIRSAPSFYLETKFITVAILNELVLSAIYYIVRHCVWSTIHPTYLYLLSFLHCQLTITVTLLLVVCTKVWYTHRPPSDRRRRTYSTSDTPIGGAVSVGIGGAESVGEPLKMSADSGVDVGEINLADMNPDDIRAELRRLYTQLQVYKTKSMRRDNPHISKRRGGRKPTHRRFSLQAFNYKHRLHQSEHSHDLEAVSRTPEESTNSADVVATVAEEPHSFCCTESPRISTSRRQ